MPQVDTEIRTSCHCPAGMFEFLFVHVDGHVGVNEMLQTAGMVQVEMTNDHGFNIFDVVSGAFYRSWQLFLLGILDTGENVGCWGWPRLVRY